MSTNSYLGTDMPPGYTPTSDEKTLALLSHVLTFIAPLLAPLIIYLVKKDESPFVAAHAKESLNFQITIIIIFIGLLVSVIGILFMWAAALIYAVLVIVATIRASDGKLYKYPFCLRLIK
jgi:uncharacterized protein